MNAAAPISAKPLFDHLHRGGGWAYWWINPGKMSTWFPVGKPASLPNRTANVYFGVHPTFGIPQRGDPKWLRATIADIAAINCLFAEFDAEHFGNDKQATLAHIDSLGVIPSVINDSGGGYHLYWFLREPYTMATIEDRKRAQEWQAAWVAYVGGDPGAKDLARVLRVPGTSNYNYDPPRPVELVRADFDRLYDLSYLVSLPPQAKPPTAPPPRGGNGRRFSDDAGDYWLGNALDRAAPGNRNATGFDLACQLRDAGLGESEAAGFMRTYAAHVPQNGSAYLESEAMASLREAYKTPAREPARRNGPGAAYSPAATSSSRPAEPPAVPTTEHLTDLGNAGRLVAQHGHELRYCYPWGKWLVWNFCRWTPDNTGEIMRLGKETVRQIYAEASALTDEDARKNLAKHALRCEAAGRITAMLDLANSEPGIPVLPEQLDADPWALNVLNGTIDLRTGQLRPHRKEDLLTKLAPVSYDPGARCPTWERFLLEVMSGDMEMVRFLQCAVGYTLTGLTFEQVMFLLHGKGANGKSTFLETLRSMLGPEYTVQIRPETLMVKQGDGIPNDVARLRGARLVNARETEEGKRMAESLVKEMTGTDTITARFLRQEYFDFRPEFKLFLAANHKPTIRGTDLAIWRRIRLIPFAVTFPEDRQDKQLAKKLLAEIPGILSWAVQGCLAWQAMGGLGTPAAVRAATEEYRAESDTLAAFLSDCTIEDPQGQAQAGPLYTAYKSWADENGEKPMNGTLFGRRLTERGLDKFRDRKSVTYYLGFRLIEAQSAGSRG